jgi:double-stranded uracil-DNA glycosylase
MSPRPSRSRRGQTTRASPDRRAADATDATPRVLTGFPPVADPSATILILGSMPGFRSLAEGQYYAHPQNAFWRLMAHVIGLDPRAPYPARLAALRDAGIALWDVLHACVRPGSADHAIVGGTRVVNDFVTFFDRHRRIARVCFNGLEAERSFTREVHAYVAERPLTYVRLPSSSAALALPFARKAAAWREAIAR